MRLAAIDRLDDTEQAILGTLAREDIDPRVRRAALTRLADVDTLGVIGRADADPQVKADAIGRLQAWASESDDLPLAGRAVAAIGDERPLAQIARMTKHEPVARAALDRLGDLKAVAGVARHAAHESVRLAALARVCDAADLEAIATHTDHKDVGLAALERLQDASAPLLDGIALRAKNKVISRRAKAIVKERAAAEAERRATQDAIARRGTLLCDAVDGLTRIRDAARVRAEVERLEETWREVAPQAPEELAQRFAAVVARARAHCDDLVRQEAMEAERRAALTEALTPRQRLIDAVATLDVADTGALTPVRAEWDALAPFEAPEVDALARDYASAVRAYEDRAAAHQRALDARSQIGALLTEAAAIVDQPDLDGARPQWNAAARRWRELAHDAPPDAATLEQYQQLDQRWRDRVAEARATAERSATEQLSGLLELQQRAEAVAAQTDAPLKDIERVLRDLRPAVEGVGALPKSDAAEALAQRLRHLLGELTPRARELRDTDEWRRWANAGIQEELCKRVEALRDLTDVSEVSRQLRDLRRQWKAVAIAPRDDADTLWARFKTAQDEAQVRVDAHTATVAVEQTENLAKKVALCEQAEGLAESTDWIPTAETLKRLQLEWQAVGPVPKDQANDLARRFRTACDTFFTRRKTDLAQRKDEWSKNLRQKEALCEKMEQLSESTDWTKTITEIKQLQAEWKTIGPVKRNKSEALWKRFRGACDKFFERYGHRHEIELQKRLGDREAVCTTLEELVPAPPIDGETAAAPPDDLIQRVEDAWRRWRNMPGSGSEALAPIRNRFETAIVTLLETYPQPFEGTRFDLDNTRNRMAALCEEVEGVLRGTIPTAQLGSSPVATLASLLKESLAANTIGGRVNEESKIRAAADRVRRAQHQWRDLGPLFGDEGRAFETRFHRACRRFFEQHPQFEEQRPPHRGGGGGRPHRPQGGRPENRQ